ALIWTRSILFFFKQKTAYEIDAVGERAIAPHELAEVLLFVPRLQRVALDQPVGLVACEPGVDEPEQQPLAVEEAVARLEVASHALFPHDQALDQPAETIEHVVEREEGIWDDHALRRGMGDVTLVPERDVLEPHGRGGTDDPR